MFDLKKIDALMIKQLVPPLVLAFCIAIFVLMMNLVYVWIDDLAGKGVSALVIAELLFYMSLTLIPTAIPVAVLLSTVMVFGTLAETYQLASFKASGISLWRIMRAPFYVILVLAIFSGFNTSYLIPQAQLKFRKRFYEIRSKKPALALETGVFNDDFNGFAIRIGSKGKNSQDIYDIMMYDVTEGSDKVNIIIAERGYMVPRESDNLFIMQFEDGVIYRDFDRKGKGRRNSEKPFVRTYFDRMTKAFDMSVFMLKDTDDDLFKQQRYMLPTQALRHDIDTIGSKIQNLETFINRRLAFDNPLMLESGQLPVEDSAAVELIRANRKETFVQLLDEVPDSSVIHTFNKATQSDLIAKAINNAESLRSEANINFNRLQGYRKNMIKSIYELHNRFSLAVACLMFLFIGAPMGAIVRKGGFGFPMLIAIVFFVTYIMSSIAFKKMAEGFTIGPVIAAWAGVLIMAPIGAVLTIMAMRDMKFSSIFNFQNVKNLFQKKDKPLS